jgi:hypothetical protein
VSRAAAPVRAGVSRAVAPAPARAVYAALARAATEALAGSAPVERRLVLGGTQVRVRAAGPALAETLLAAFAHADDAHPSAAAAITIDLFDTATTDVPPPPLPETAREVGARGELAGSGGEVRALFHGNPLAPERDFRAVSAFSRRRAHGVLWVLSPDRVPWWERAAPLRTLLHWSLGDPPRRLLVHAAAVAGRCRGALLIGAGGSGKSTTAVACVAAGMTAAGDDYALLDAVAGIAHPLYATAKLTPAGIGLIPGLEPAVWPPVGTGDEKRVVDLARLWPERIGRSVPVDVLVMPRVVAGGRTRLCRASGADALRALAPTTILQLPGENRAVLGPLAELARRLPAYVLELGGTPREAAAELDRLLGGEAGR